ncbi:MAG: methyltransferase domain-containing protein [Micropruina sp.]|nr:methyltransferase domain-containing protein [Micropruina sp.]
MQPVEGARTFQVASENYDRFMGRYSKPLATSFAAFAGIDAALRVLDVGCGPGALTSELVGLVGTAQVAACDPSPPFVAACAARHPGVQVRAGSAEHVPFDDDAFDAAVAQLVLHFVSDPKAAASELRRVTRAGGTVAACVWDFDEGMQMLRAFWDAAVATDPDAPNEAQVLRFGRHGELSQWLADGGFDEIDETQLHVDSTYRDFEELWGGFEAGIGPAGDYLKGRGEGDRVQVREAFFERVGRPESAFTLHAVARAVRGCVAS